MISNVLSLNLITEKYKIAFYSGDENDLKLHSEDKIVKFPSNYDRIYLSKTDKLF